MTGRFRRCLEEKNDSKQSDEIQASKKRDHKDDWYDLGMTEMVLMTGTTRKTVFPGITRMSRLTRMAGMTGMTLMVVMTVITGKTGMNRITEMPGISRITGMTGRTRMALITRMTGMN